MNQRPALLSDRETVRCIFYISAATIWLFAITATLLALIKVLVLIHFHAPFIDQNFCCMFRL